MNSKKNLKPLRRNIRIVNKALFILFTFYLVLSTRSLAFDVTASKSVTVSASIGDNRVTIFGYTSPRTRVELSSRKVFAITYSDNTGYFVFDKTLLPKNPSELCLTAIEDCGRNSSPVCIPAPPASNYHTDIGPIILPPTIAIDSEHVVADSTTIASGQSIPNSDIEIHLYQVSDRSVPFVKTAEAFGLPIFNTKTDKDGNYSFNVPTSYQSNYRLYSTVKYFEDFSPKSNTLTYLLPTQSNYYFFILILIPLFIFILLFRRPKKHYYPAIFSYPLVKINQ